MTILNIRLRPLSEFVISIERSLSHDLPTRDNDYRYTKILTHFKKKIATTGNHKIRAFRNRYERIFSLCQLFLKNTMTIYTNFDFKIYHIVIV